MRSDEPDKVQAEMPAPYPAFFVTATSQSPGLPEALATAYNPGRCLLALSVDICSARTEMERRKAPAPASCRAVDLLIIDFRLIVERKAEYEISLKISETTLEASSVSPVRSVRHHRRLCMCYALGETGQRHEGDPG